MESNRKEQNQPELEEQTAAAGEAMEAAAEEETEEVKQEAAAVEDSEEKEEAPAAEPEKPQKKRSIRKALRSNKFKRGGMATVMSLVFIAVIVVINIFVGLLTDRFPSLNLDLTANKMNTLSDQAERVAGEVNTDTTLYLIGAEDGYRKDTIGSRYGVSSLKFSQVANLAEKLQEANSKISVEFIDPDTNPTFISEYSSENLMTGDVLVKTEKRYRVVDVNDMFSRKQNSTTGATEYVSTVDSALAAAIELVNMEDVPVIAIATGHEELLNEEATGSFRSLMEDQNFTVQEFNILTDEIPEDTQILMIPTPNTDYTTEELDKIRAYLDDEDAAQRRSLLVTCYTSQGELPRLQAFLEEWGVAVEEGVVAETDTSRIAGTNASVILVDAENEVMKGEYNNLVTAMSRPLRLVFEGNGDVSAKALWTTSDGAYVLTKETEQSEEPQTAQQTVATLSLKYVSVDGSNYPRSVIVFGSSHIFTDSYIQASAFGDRQYITDVMKYAAGTDGSSVSVYTESVQTSTRDVAASQSTVVMLGLGVFTVGIPLLILVVGLVIFLKRRHL